MRSSVFTLFIFIGMSTMALLPAQINSQYTRDSIEIEKGVAGTTDFEPYFKVINESFDEENRPLRTVVYEYITPTELVPVQRQTFQYENGFTVSFLLESWDNSEEEWHPIKQETSTYENDLLSSFLRRKPIDGVLVNERLWLYGYNMDGNETSKLLQSWDTDTETWENLSRKITTYTPEGNILAQLLQRYQDDDWRNSRRRGWTWTVGDLQPSLTIAQRWSEADQDWVNVSRKTYGMSANGLWASAIVEDWNADTDTWVNDIKETFTIDFSENTAVMEGELWSDGWQPNLKNQYSYSDNRNTALLQQWNELEAQYEDFLRYRSLSNAIRLPIEKVGMQRWNADNQIWENRNYTRRITYHWTEDMSTTTGEIAWVDHCIIPNPYLPGTKMFCNLPDDHGQVYLELTNMYGQVLVREKVTNSEMEINASLNAGLYIVKVYEPGQIYHLEKIVIAD